MGKKVIESIVMEANNPKYPEHLHASTIQITIISLRYQIHQHFFNFLILEVKLILFLKLTNYSFSGLWAIILILQQLNSLSSDHSEYLLLPW